MNNGTIFAIVLAFAAMVVGLAVAFNLKGEPQPVQPYYYEEVSK